MSDAEDREWTKKFGESYLECQEDHLEEEEINDLEEEFLRDGNNTQSPRSAYGSLDEIDEQEHSDG